MQCARYLIHSTLVFIFVFVAYFASAQLDPRERYGTLLGGGVQANRSLACYPACADQTSPSSTFIQAVSVDSSGNLYVGGNTTSVDFPTTSGAYDRQVNFNCDHSGNCQSQDTFLSKFNASGQLIWSTYLGWGGPVGSANVVRLGLDPSGNVVVVGSATPPGLSTEDCGAKPFILKFSATGSLLYSNFLSHCLGPQGFLVTDAVIGSGRYVYIVGLDGDGILAPTPGANTTDFGSDDRLIKVDTLQPVNNGIMYIAALLNESFGVTLNSQGNAFVLGQDTRVTKFDSQGAIIFSVNYLPSFAYAGQRARIIATSTGDVIFTATVFPQGAYPTTASFGTIDSSSAGNDAVIVRLNGTGGERVYSVAIRNGTMFTSGLARNSADEAFVTGDQSGSALSINRYSNAPASGGFLLRVNSNGNSVWLESTFGGNEGLGITVDSAWNAWVVGYTNSGQYFPLTSNAYQSSFKGALWQGFIAKLIIEADVKTLTQKISANPVGHGSNPTYTFAVYNNGPDVSDGDTITDVLPSGTTFVSYSTTNGTCTHPAVGSGGTFKCMRGGVLNKGSYWGPITLTVHVNAPSGSTLKNTASVAAKTQDVFSSNNSSTTYVRVQ